MNNRLETVGPVSSSAESTLPREVVERSTLVSVAHQNNRRVAQAIFDKPRVLLNTIINEEEKPVDEDDDDEVNCQDG